MSQSTRYAIVTGASAGIGEAAVRHLSDAGFRVIGGARRVERVRAATDAVGGVALALDVTDPASIEAFLAGVREHADKISLLVNNAGGALGLESIEEAFDEKWRVMYETNVLGTMRMTRALLPMMPSAEDGGGHVINVGSIAGFETYPGGAGYTAAKHGQRALTLTLRKELIGKPIRVTEIAPGLVETEFSMVRFDGDEDRATQVYAGMTPLVADDVADCIAWAATRPPHVNIDEIVVRPLDQATAHLVHRRQD